jgi:DNA repair exonuclease SbcCD ATPase subunit
MSPESKTTPADIEALDHEAVRIEHEAEELKTEAKEVERLAEKMERHADELEREARRLAHHPCPPAPVPRPVQPPRVHGYVAA